MLDIGLLYHLIFSKASTKTPEITATFLLDFLALPACYLTVMTNRTYGDDSSMMLLAWVEDGDL